MQASNILTADLLDIIFDERNKEYGAYDLRKNYQQRLMRSMLVMFLIVVLIFIVYVLFGSMNPNLKRLDSGPVVILEPIAPPEKKPEIIITPPVKFKPVNIKTIQFTIPRIVNENVPEEEKPPVTDDIDRAKIGTVTRDGKDDDGLLSPIQDDGKGIIDVPKKNVTGDEPFTKVEIESEYPGGSSAWAAFLNRNLSYPEAAVEKEVQGTVTIQFIVDVLGNVSDVTAISGPEELRTAAVTVIKKSGKWIAAIQNGQKVKSYKKQPITFRVGSD
jgi:periplasmic protein TonB